jgi:hypothetical protein
VASVVAAGERERTTIQWTDTSGKDDRSQSEARLPAIDELVELSFTVSSGSPHDVRIWVHRIDDEGVSRPWPVDIEVDEGTGGYPVTTDDLGLADFVIGKDGARIRLSRPESRGGTT